MWWYDVRDLLWKNQGWKDSRYAINGLEGAMGVHYTAHIENFHNEKFTKCCYSFKGLCQMPVSPRRFSRFSNQIPLIENYLHLFYGLCNWTFKFSLYH